MDLELTDLVIIVTGASAGIGQATVELLAAEGAHVVGASRKPDALDGPGVTAVAVDLTAPGGPEELISAALERHGRLDGLVNNVGGVTARGGFLEVDDKAWRSALELNLLTAVRTTRAALPALLERGGAILHVASEAAHLPDPPIVDYAAAKAALLSLSKALATEFGGRGVRSNVVSPGPTRTRLWDAPGGFADQLAEQFELEREAAIEHFVTEVRGLTLDDSEPPRTSRESSRFSSPPPAPRSPAPNTPSMAARYARSSGPSHDSSPRGPGYAYCGLGGTSVRWRPQRARQASRPSATAPRSTSSSVLTTMSAPASASSASSSCRATPSPAKSPALAA